jgi:PAS domain S-box-containing protein
MLYDPFPFACLERGMHVNADATHSQNAENLCESAGGRGLPLSTKGRSAEGPPSGYLLTDCDGLITEASASAIDLLGVTSNKLIGRMLSDALPEAGRGTFREELRRLCRTRDAERWQVMLERVDGGAIVAQFTVQPIKEKNHGKSMLLWFIENDAQYWRLPHSEEETPGTQSYDV